ncbi:uncharacterized protein EV422DRAFT_507349 [Fimicolochytrium jonesii]|uniref:uncharacterized protein n=1 Tax=Fimicolochytrium jonesii TaxID=1396493 RepID=UPI0022FE0FD3|nr:uncharacterized protein EV422DRAFT_507349 [Fimicolochytrium jonesii]KAI8819727.1 hypothetical protein EV422DRAFT_507349 [Fimicolochytrium jonesii]
MLAYTAQAGDHDRLGIIERFNRTIKTFLARYFTATGQKAYVNALPQFTENYNNQVHSVLGKAPARIKDGDIPDSLEQNVKALDDLEGFNIGDDLRIKEDRNVFKKGYSQQFSKLIYIIGGRNGYGYKLFDTKGVPQKRMYKARDLLKINDVQKAPRGDREIARLQGVDVVLPEPGQKRKRKPKKIFGE